MRAKKENKWPRWTLLGIVGLIVCAVCFVLAVEVLPATVQYPIAFGPDYDSIWVYWWEKSGTDWDLDDSMKITNMPITDSIALDDAKDYKIIYWYYDGADSIPSGEFIKFTAGAATISTTDKQEIAHFDAETTLVRFGSPPYTTGGIGTGPYSVTIVTVDTAAGDTVPVPYVYVIARNAAQTTTPASGNTDINGELEVNLAAETHVFIASEVGYTWPTYDSHVVAGSQTDTIWGVRWIPDAPSDTFLCRLWGYAQDVEKNGIYKAELSVTPKKDTFNTCDNVILSSASVNTETDDSGYFEIDVLISSCRGNARYDIELTAPRTGAVIGSKKNYLIPDSATHKLTF